MWGQGLSETKVRGVTVGVSVCVCVRARVRRIT